MLFKREYIVEAFQFLPDENDKFNLPDWFLDYYRQSKEEFDKKIDDFEKKGTIYFGFYDNYEIKVVVSAVRKIKRITLCFRCLGNYQSASVGDWIMKKDKRIFRIKKCDFKEPEWTRID